MASIRFIHFALPQLTLLIAAHSTVWSQDVYPVNPAYSGGPPNPGSFAYPQTAPIDPPARWRGWAWCRGR